MSSDASAPELPVLPVYATHLAAQAQQRKNTSEFCCPACANSTDLPDMALTDHAGLSALHVAVRRAVDTDIVRLLLAAGARANAMSRNGCTPLLIAAQRVSDRSTASLASDCRCAAKCDAPQLSAPCTPHK